MKGQKSITLLILFVALVAATAQAQWSTATISSARSTLAATSAGNSAIFGGGIGMISIPPPALDMYNYGTGTWTSGSISQGRTWLAAAATGNVAMFAGGADDWILSVFNIVDQYNATSNVWTTNQLSDARTRLAGAAYGSKILFAGGMDANMGVR